MELLKAAARQRLAAGQGELDLGLQPSGGRGGGPLPIRSSRMGCLLDALAHGYDVLGFGHGTGGDDCLRNPLVRAAGVQVWLAELLTARQACLHKKSTFMRFFGLARLLWRC
jgi:hypothetical protein